MRSLRDIRKSISHAGIGAKPEADRVVLRHLVEELEKAAGEASVRGTRRGWKTVAANRAVQALAAAAVVILALTLMVRSLQRIPPPPTERRAQSAADLLTVGCLNAACRRGGIEELDRQCEEAARRLGTRPERVSTRELIREFDGAPASRG